MHSEDLTLILGGTGNTGRRVAERLRYISYFPDVAVPGAPEAIEAFAHEALAAGARRLVLLSGRNAQLTDRVQRAPGREPRDFAREAAAAGAWSAA